MCNINLKNIEQKTVLFPSKNLKPGEKSRKSAITYSFFHEAGSQ